jgi:hypothetical protein
VTLIDASRFDWRKREWDAAPGSEKSVDIGYKALHLYDGGIYDNLGLEPFFDAGKGRTKHPEHFIIVSDAGSPLPRGFSFWVFQPPQAQADRGHHVGSGARPAHTHVHELPSAGAKQRGVDFHQHSDSDFRA